MYTTSIQSADHDSDHNTLYMNISGEFISVCKLFRIKTLTTWLYCFTAYMAVQTSDPPTRELLTYTSLIIRDALRAGGDGLLTYDRLFREHAALVMGEFF